MGASLGPSLPPSELRPYRWVLLALLALGVALRLVRFPFRWNYWFLDGLSYSLHTEDLLLRGDLWALPRAFTGLHPPLGGLVHGALTLSSGGPWSHLALSLGAEMGAIACASMAVRRWKGPDAGLLTAGLASVSCLRVSQGLDPSGYPLASLAVGLAFLAVLPSNAPSPKRDPIRSWAGGGAGLLGGWSELGGALWVLTLWGVLRAEVGWKEDRGRRRGARWMFFGLLTALPTFWGWWDRLQASGTFHPNLQGIPEKVLSALSRCGGGVWVWGGGVALGMLAVGWLWSRERTGFVLLALPLLVYGGALTAGFWSGAASTHQVPYHLLPSLGMATTVGVAWGDGLLVPSRRSAWVKLWKGAMVTLVSLWVLGQGMEHVRFLGIASSAWKGTPPPALVEHLARDRPLLVLWDSPFGDQEIQGIDAGWASLPPSWFEYRCPSSREIRRGFCWQGRDSGPIAAWNEAGFPGGEEEQSFRQALRSSLEEGPVLLWVMGWRNGERPEGVARMVEEEGGERERVDAAAGRILWRVFKRSEGKNVGETSPDTGAEGRPGPREF